MSFYFWDFEPFRELNSLHHHFDNLHTKPALEGKASSDLSRCKRSCWRPNLDVKETDKDFVLHVDAPGVAEKDINVNIENGLLTVSGKRESTKKEENERFHRVERSMGSFSRSVALPDGIDPAKVTASFENGVLEVRVPKPEVQQPRKISINVGGAKQITGATEPAVQPAVQPAEPALPVSSAPKL